MFVWIDGNCLNREEDLKLLARLYSSGFSVDLSVGRKDNHETQRAAKTGCRQPHGEYVISQSEEKQFSCKLYLIIIMVI